MASQGPVRPVQQEDISIAWLQSKLGPTVKSFNLTRKVNDQTAGKAYITITHEDGTEQHLCLKGFVNSATPEHHAMVMALYKAEVAFYELLAPPLRNLGLVIPKTFGADDGLLILEDISKQGSKFGTAGETLSIETVKGYAEQLAILHGETWGRKDLPASSAYKTLVFGLTHFWPMLDDPKRPQVPDSLKDKERFVIALEEYFKSVKYRSLIHGDAHTGNTFTLSDGSIGFLDWQLYDIGSPFQDLAYLVVGSLSIEDRRAHEIEILDEYLEKLAKHGGPKLARDDVLTEYKVSSIIGFPWSLTPSEMQSMERLVTMTDRYCASILDHDVIGKLLALRTNSAN